MIGIGEKRRVLLAARDEGRQALRPLFETEALASWDLAEAESFSQARFVLQYDPRDLLLVHQDLLDSEGGQGLAWMVWNRKMPVVFLSNCATSSALAYDLGASLCVPLDEVRSHPILLAKALERALHWHALEVHLESTRLRLEKTRRHVDRMVNAMWRMTPAVSDSPWFSQRYMMERLQEELSRSKRHQVPLTVALGELNEEMVAEGTLPHWTVEAIIRTKRRSDIVGQYGQNGFLLLMVHTPVEGGLNCVRRLQKIIEHTREALPAPHVLPRAYFGLSHMNEQRETAVSLLRAAEEGLETARQHGRERIAAS